MLMQNFLTKSAKSKKVIVLGVSGSVGATTLQYLNQHSEFELLAVSIHSNGQILKQVCERADVRHLAITSPDINKQQFSELFYIDKNQRILNRKNNNPMSLYYGVDGLMQLLENCAAEGADTVIIAISGAAAIPYTVRCLLLGLKIGLANKESLVSVGSVIEWLYRECHKNEYVCRNPLILPIDSEHNSLFQLSERMPREEIDKWLITASGGPFLHHSFEQIKKMKKKDVLSHPNWKMGAKITVDSAGMINKGLEVIEAMRLFSLSLSDIKVVIHPQSYVHSMLLLKNGSSMLHASTPDMSFPVAHTLHYPENAQLEGELPELWPSLQFVSIQPGQFPGYDLALACAKRGGILPAIFNAANESAVFAFLEDQIAFYQIPIVIDQVLEKIDKMSISFVPPKEIASNKKLEDLFDYSEQFLQPFLDADKLARIYSEEIAQTLKQSL